VGELYVCFPDQQLGVVGPSGNIDLLAVRNFSATTDYVVGDLVARGGDIYRAAVAVTAGAWNATQWTDIVRETDKHHGVTLFDPSKGYLQNELVVNNGEIYRANAVVAAGAFNAASWTKISPTPPSMMGVAQFNQRDTYAQDELVSYQGKIYRAKTALPVGPWDATKWEDININPTAGVVPFSATANYSIDDLVSYQGKIYRATIAITAGAWNAANWADTNTNLTDAIRAFDPAKSYAPNDIVWNAGKIYRANGLTPAGAWNAAQWTEVGATPTFPITNFDATKTYAQNDIVINAGKLYSALNAVPAGAFDATKWKEIGSGSATSTPDATPANDAGKTVALGAAGLINPGFIQDKIIVSTTDPDPAQGGQNWLWLKVSA
jgi:hypothetical protein